MRRPGAPRAAAACGLATVALLGCGEVSDSHFRSQVDGICKRSAEHLTSIPPPPPSDFAANGSYAGQVATLVQKSHDKLKAVEAPSSKSSEYKKWVAGFAELGHVIGKRGAAAGARDAQSFNALVAEENTLLQESKAKAALLGFKQCSK